ncbi:hypothetical protein [Alkalimarinus alittae]|uniref:DUF945 domain-containing protein n=1 Tax=Alkalimarinus alittae TaxID=2961619 RepID=A0ABY6N0U5_9ALTE|nr:hypothetical protein [Alkalimarinus alittae]UZE95723.1 hypothetical protein NKI27_16925 [Alkalimarinus alittae]
MKKIFWGIVFISVALIGSYKGYLWYQVYQQLSEVKEQVAPFAMVKYGWIYSTFDGEVGVRDIKITPYLLKGTISIDELSLKAKDAMALLSLGDKFAQRTPPEELRIKTTNMSFPLDGRFEELLNSLDVSSDITHSGDGFNPFGVYSCGDTASVKGPELIAMGYDRFTVSSEVGYRFNFRAERLVFDATVDSESMGRSEFSVDVGVSGRDIYDVVRSNTLPVINRATWRFNDNGFYRRLSFYCSKKTETERPRYVEQAAQEWDADLKDHGITLNASLVDTYRDYILDGGLLNVEVSPDRGIDYSSLSLFSANDIISMLNVRIMLNGVLLPDLSLTIDEQQFSTTTDDGQPLTGGDVTSTDSAEALVVVKSYQETEIEEAAEFLKRRALIELDTGKRVEGMIILVDEHFVELEQIVAGGKVSYPLRKRNITSFKVWR